MEHVHLSEVVVDGKRLGRHVEHDPRSRAFAYEARRVAPLVTVSHRSFGLPLTQGNLGSCTGNATAGALNTEPLRKAGWALGEPDAVRLYELATTLDGIPGTYPPHDTGSSGLAAAKAAKQLGYITSYRHAFSITDALAALQEAAVITGVNWLEGFDQPTPDGFVQMAGQSRGGHEFIVVGYTAARTPYVTFCNSWGKGWGNGGYAKMTVDTWAKLLADQGDATILH